MVAGYSGTPLAKKLGYKASMRACVINAPETYMDLLSPLPEGVTFAANLKSDLDLLHVFIKERDELEKMLPTWQSAIKRDGMIWVSWPKKTSKVATTLDGNIVRELVLKLDLVDIKVCAVDDIWSGLKMVIRKELR